MNQERLHTLEKELRKFENVGIYIDTKELAKEKEIDTIYKTILQPLYNYLLQLKLLNKLDFSIDLFKETNEIEVYIRNSTSDISIPKTLRNIRLDDSALQKEQNIITVQDINSLVIDNTNHLDLTTMALQGKIHTNNLIELLHRLENIYLKDLEFINTLDISNMSKRKVKYHYDEVGFNTLRKLLIYHYKLVGNTLNKEEIHKLGIVISALENVIKPTKLYEPIDKDKYTESKNIIIQTFKKLIQEVQEVKQEVKHENS